MFMDLCLHGTIAYILACSVSSCAGVTLSELSMRIPLLSWLFLVPIYYVSLSFHVFVVSSQCPSDQQSLLLQLKNGLQFTSTSSKKLAQWKNGSDYCSWEGVSCKDGCVSHLDLSSESISGGLNNSNALFDLQYIENLNLAYNNFNNTQIPSKFDKLTNLSYLNLSNAGFVGQIPIEISHLTRLVTLDLSILDLSTFYFSGPLKLENPNLNVLLGNLSELIELHLDGVSISDQGTEWCEVISSSLPKLKVLSLSACSLSGPIDISLQKLHSLSVIRLEYNNLSAQVPEFFSNFTNLTSLHLSYSGLDGTFPKKIFQVPTLQTIDLSGNQQLQGSLPEFPKNGSLRSLVLSGANFTGFFPSSMGDLKMLSRIDVSSCNFTGSIPRSMENLTQLIYVDLSVNKFNGSVPFFSMAKNLSLIDLSYNQLTGQINSSHWENLTNLVNLNMRHNLLDGTIPPSLFSLPVLQKLQLAYNQFSGQLLGFATMSVLDTLDLSSNKLEGPVPMSIFNLKGLKILSLSSNNFSGSFPLELLPQLKNLSSLDLSYNSLSINYNTTNSSATSFPQITTLNLVSSKLTRFPDFLRNQSKLSNLDLSQNQIYGEIPNWIWRLSNLVQLNLSCNSLETLEGPLLNVTFSLSVLDLHSNQLQGQIPLFPPSAYFLDYSRNNFNSSIWTDIGDFLYRVVFLSLSSNKFHGIIPESICNLRPEVLDLSNNSLSGMIPRCLIAMSDTLGVLNLQRNQFSGIIPDKFPVNCSLKTLELNENQIEGKLPKSLANCTILEVLNLGNNQITDTYPCMLKSISTLRVLVLRWNKFYEHIGCPTTNETWPMLQIIDIAHNNFSGEIPGRYLRTWRAMMAHKDDEMSELNHHQFEVQLGGVYYLDAMTVTNKGVEMELVKILTLFTSIDMSCNKFNGSIPEELGELKSLYCLNLSNNALAGTIPSSLGNLRQLESLDLSNNSLSGPIPPEVGGLTFLSFLDLSNNQLVGQIPVSTQISTFPASSFAGNKGLWGTPLTVDNKAGLSPTPALNGSLPNSGHHGINWDLISVEIGFTLGFGFSILSLVLCKRWSKWYYRAMYNILLKIFPQLEERIGIHRRHVHINQRWRR